MKVKNQIQLSKISTAKKTSVARISSSLLHVRRLVYMSIMTALIIVGAKVTIGFGPVPFTLQTICIGIAAYVLGSIWGGLTAIIYLLLGAMGLPVFASGGGIDKLIGPTGGFIIGFIPMAIIIGASKRFDSDIIQMLFGIISIVILYIFGTAILVRNVNGKSFEKTLAGMITTFGLKDVVSIILAQVVAKKVKSRLGDALIVDDGEQ